LNDQTGKQIIDLMLDSLTAALIGLDVNHMTIEVFRTTQNALSNVMFQMVGRPRKNWKK
jgi:hypothetical protein